MRTHRQLLAVPFVSSNLVVALALSLAGFPSGHAAGAAEEVDTEEDEASGLKAKWGEHRVKWGDKAYRLEEVSEVSASEPQAQATSAPSTTLTSDPAQTTSESSTRSLRSMEGELPNEYQAPPPSSPPVTQDSSSQ
jgi:hypothetical protein